MHPHVALLVKAELKKLLKVGFIQAIDYIEWISNIVMVFKHEKSIRVYTYFLDMIIACVKDDFPLPNIDMIVDMIAGYEMMDFLIIIRSKLHQKIKKRLLHLCMENFILEHDAIWLKKCWCHISKSSYYNFS